MLFKAIIQVLLIVLFSVIALWMDGPIKVQPEDSDSFSASRALEDIEQLADKIHFIGSPANKEKKDYIIERFSSLGYKTSVYTGESHIQWGGNYRQAKTENILALKKGSEGKKIVVVLGHYDSVSNSPGAADDIHAVACMLEVADLIGDKQFKNDILFLVTDGEETGLHGARAYAQNFDLDSIGIVLNFEARGNTGPSYAFEWSDNNYWLVKAFSKNVSKPIANSLSYEVYNRMPNGSDFTEFKERGIPGINHAFIDGFAYYHSPIDLPENINLQSVQHSGDYMHNLIQYFGDADLEQEHKGNATFFNFYPILIVYPSWADVIILTFIVFMFLWVITQWMKTKQVTFRGFLLSFLFSVLTVLFIGIIGYGFQVLIKWLYPHYWSFYAGQFYNHKWYLLALTGLSIVIHALAGRWIFRKWGHKTYVASTGFIWLVLSIAIYLVAPSAAYLMLAPLFFYTLYYLLDTLSKEPKKRIYYKLIPYLLTVITIGIWVPAIHSLFLAFSLSALAGPAVVVALLLMYIMPLTQDMWGMKRFSYILGGFLLIFSLVMGDLSSEPTAESPLPSNLNYYYNQNDSTAFWITRDSRLNEANAGALENAGINEVAIPWKVSRMSSPTELDYHFPVEVDTIVNVDSTISSFTFVNNSLFSYVHFQDVTGVESVAFNSKQIFHTDSSSRDNFTLSLYGYGGDTLKIDIMKYQELEQGVTITTYNEGLPRKDIIPDNFMRTGGNTITTLNIHQ